MAAWAVWGWVPEVLNIIIVLLSLFLILLVLIQRGKGGGLAGAFGGMGGSSAFGSRAGDLFTRITIVVFGVWLLLAMIEVYVLQRVYKEGESENATVLDVSGSK
jgi:preprotein translocase subunit SecG